MQKMHSRCAYYELLRHYCPLSSRKLASRTLSRAGAPDNSNTTADASQSRSALKVTFTEIPIAKGRLAREPANLETPVVDHATPVSGVSAFCRAVLANLVPNDFWGQGVDGDDNRTVIMHQIDRFIRLRRFESLTLHAVYQSLKVVDGMALFKWHADGSVDRFYDMACPFAYPIGCRHFVFRLEQAARAPV